MTLEGKCVVYQIIQKIQKIQKIQIIWIISIIQILNNPIIQIIIQIIIFPFASRKRRQVADSVRRSSSASIVSRKAEKNNCSEGDDRLIDDYFTQPKRRGKDTVDGPPASGGPSPEWLVWKMCMLAPT